MKRARVLLVAALLGALLPLGDAWARVGGGEGYSGGSGSNGGGGGGGGGGGEADIIFLLIRIAIEYPCIGLPLLAAFVGFLLYQKSSEASQRLHGRRTVPQAAGGRPPLPWHRLREGDPGFSRVVLLDFLGRLFVRFQTLQGHGSGDVETLAPYLDARVLDTLREARTRNDRARRRVVGVVVGGLAPRHLEVQPDGRQVLALDLEFNVGVAAEGAAGGGSAAEPPAWSYVRQIWRLERERGARSPTPEQARSLGCPSCGAPVNLSAENRCTYCETVIGPGKLTWKVVAVTVQEKRPRHEYNVRLQGGVEEGTEIADVVAPDLDAGLAAFRARHPTFDPDAFLAQAKDAFLRLQRAWSAQEWQAARALETDHLFHSHLFFLENLEARGLVNRHEQVSISRARLVRVESDLHYDAITVRLHARGLDYTLRGADVVAGSKTKPRAFSEYWTFVRTAGFDASKLKAHEPSQCPNCGAALEINQAGECTSCDSTVTSGAFGWVLSQIEQDEAYTGA